MCTIYIVLCSSIATSFICIVLVKLFFRSMCPILSVSRTLINASIRPFPTSVMVSPDLPYFIRQLCHTKLWSKLLSICPLCFPTYSLFLNRNLRWCFQVKFSEITFKIPHFKSLLMMKR